MSQSVWYVSINFFVISLIRSAHLSDEMDECISEPSDFRLFVFSESGSPIFDNTMGKRVGCDWFIFNYDVYIFILFFFFLSCTCVCCFFVFFCYL